MYSTWQNTMSTLHCPNIMSTWVDFTKPLFAKQKVAGTQRSVKNLPFSFTKIISLWNWLISSNNYFEICGPFAKHRPEKKLLISFPQKSFEKMLVKSPPCASMFLSKTRQIFSRQLFSRQHFCRQFFCRQSENFRNGSVVGNDQST